MDLDSTSMLLFLKLTTDFDTIDHCILDCLENRFGVSGPALACFKSYSSERTLCISYYKTTAMFSDARNGVPQGSVLGPLLFSLHISPPKLYALIELNSTVELIILSPIFLLKPFFPRLLY